MNIVAIIQARMTSSRLPQKVLLPLAGKPVLEHIVERLKFCSMLNNIVVATSSAHSDNEIETWCANSKTNCFRGNLEDVLDRYYQAANFYGADVIVRITGDCPAIDPQVVDEVVTGYLAGDYDAYSLAGEFPDGLDCQVFSYSALENAWRDAVLFSDREHVGSYIENTRPELFKRGTLIKFSGLLHHRWTLDEPQDYEFLSAVFNRLYVPNIPFSTQDVLDLLTNEQGLMQINSGILRNEGYLKSILVESV